MSRTDDRDLEALIDAYVEGVLDTVQVMDFQRRLEEDEDLRLRVETVRRRNSILRDSLGRLSRSGWRAFESAEPDLSRISESRARANRALQNRRQPHVSMAREPAPRYGPDEERSSADAPAERLPDFEEFWKSVRSLQHTPFATGRGAKLSYLVDGELLIVIDTPIQIHRKELERAYYRLEDTPPTEPWRRSRPKSEREDCIESILSLFVRRF